jgi:transposase
LEEAKTEKRVVLFLDAAHFVHSVYTGFLWCFNRIFIQSNSGRFRWNVLGALDAVSLKVHTFCNDSYITSTTVCLFLEQLRTYYGNMPITIFLDNAKYQRCELVIQCASKFDIDLEFLPTYSPNLNLIERFWKFVKKKCLYSRFYSNFSDFKNEINAFISKADMDYKKELITLLSWNFQSFSNVNVLTV